MERDMVKIDEALCTGCGNCIPNCHEGALQIIDGKAVLVSELMCDGLGACLGHCPEGAITIEKREALAYDEKKVMEEMTKKSENTIIAHLNHLKDHDEKGYLREGLDYLIENENNIHHDVSSIINRVMANESSKKGVSHLHNEEHNGCGCQGSAPREFKRPVARQSTGPEESALTHWPVQMHLINPAASYFSGSDLLVAADCSAYTIGNFHQQYLKNRTLVIACPKLDQGTDIYIRKLKELIDTARVNTITVLIMEVPCCGGLLEIVRQAADQSTRKVPVRLLVAGIRGDILKDEWL